MVTKESSLQSAVVVQRTATLSNKSMLAPSLGKIVAALAEYQGHAHHQAWKYFVAVTTRYRNDRQRRWQYTTASPSLGARADPLVQSLDPNNPQAGFYVQLASWLASRIPLSECNRTSLTANRLPFCANRRQGRCPTALHRYPPGAPALAPPV